MNVSWPLNEVFPAGRSGSERTSRRMHPERVTAGRILVSVDRAFRWIGVFGLLSGVVVGKGA